MPTWSRPQARNLTCRSLPAVLLVLVALLATSCGGGNELVVGVATSVRDTGLIDELVREFKEENPGVGTVKPVGAGSGQLIELARRGEVDVIISHWPEGEAQLIADDHAMVWEGLERILNAEPDIEVVGQAEDSQSAIDGVTRLQPDVAVLDIEMPGLSGLAATRCIRAARSRTQVVILSVHDTRDHIHHSLRAGARVRAEGMHRRGAD